MAVRREEPTENEDITTEFVKKGILASKDRAPE